MRHGGRNLLIAANYVSAVAAAKAMGWKPFQWAYIDEAAQLNGLDRGTRVFVTANAHKRRDYSEFLHMIEARGYAMCEVAR